MAVLWIVLIVLAVLGVLGAVFFRRALAKRGYDRWLGTFLRTSSKRRPVGPDEDVHLILCMADHYEPKSQGASAATGQARVNHWVKTYRQQFARFHDADGKHPRYSFFFPEEEYEPGYLDALAGLCRDGFGEVEVHLHHDGDTSAGFRDKIVRFRDLLASRHGLLSRRRDNGELTYAFIHGNWALCNSRPDGRWCGVNDELKILHETGCYADLTFPSAPDLTQPPKINSIYYAWDRPGRPRSHEEGIDIGQGEPPPGSLLLVQGPLLLDWGHRKYGLAPKLENGCMQATQPPSLARLDLWLRARIGVPRRPDWFFVKLHAHGAPEDAHEVLLGDPMVRFHEALAQKARDNPRFHYHYVTAREMVNLIKAAEAGFTGTVNEARDWALVGNG